ncbi:TorF family putative porin [Azonexus sp.]|uniref:TorF family putative porin n=1 Tax=Azonexus sp. TaxID=1872668 RepID=UPI0035AE3BF5
MKKSLIALAIAGAVAAPAIAEDSPHTLSANVGLATDYIFRGISQTDHKPAIQGGFDYSHASGLYAGTWASNVSWVDNGIKDDNSMEWDFYAGYRGSFAGDFTYDVGGLYYFYPGKQKEEAPGALPQIESPNSFELYASIGWKFLTLKYSHALSENLFAWQGYDKTTGWNRKDTKGSGYLDLTASYPIAEGWTIIGHVGHQKIKNNSSASYTDWKLGVTKDVGFGVVGLSYTDTNARGCGDSHAMYCWGNRANVDVGKGRAVLSFTKSF